MLKHKKWIIYSPLCTVLISCCSWASEVIYITGYWMMYGKQSVTSDTGHGGATECWLKPLWWLIDQNDYDWAICRAKSVTEQLQQLHSTSLVFITEAQCLICVFAFQVISSGPKMKREGERERESMHTVTQKPVSPSAEQPSTNTSTQQHVCACWPSVSRCHTHESRMYEKRWNHNRLYLCHLFLYFPLRKKKKKGKVIIYPDK